MTEKQIKEKKKKEPIIYKNIEFDSLDELYFYWWCEEAKQAGLLLGFKYHPTPFVLTEAIKFARYTPGTRQDFKKLGDYSLGLRKVVFEADFLLIFSMLAVSKKMIGMVEPTPQFGKEYCGHPDDYHFLGHEKGKYPYAIIDVKPPKAAFSKNIASGRDFGIKRNWFMQLHGLYVNETVVINNKEKNDCLFSKTFGPRKYLFRPRKDGKGFYINHANTVLIEEYMKNG